MSPASEVSQILVAVDGGDRSRAGRLVELVYDELRGLARHYLEQRRWIEPLQPTELVHEAFVKLVGHGQRDWRGRSHFFAVAATAMRQILVDSARGRLRGKRGGGAVPLPLDAEQVLSVRSDEDVLFVDGAIRRLAHDHPELGHLVELRFFGGLTIEDIAEATGTSPRTLHRRWVVARAWLRRELE